MLRPVITATALIALAGSSLAYAQHNFGGGTGLANDEPRFEQRHRLSVADVSAFADARIAALKAGLQLTSDQAKNWPQFEQAVRDLVQLRIQRLQARQDGDQQQPGTPFERLSQRADNMAKTSAALKRSLTPARRSIRASTMSRKAVSSGSRACCARITTCVGVMIAVGARTGVTASRFS